MIYVILGGVGTGKTAFMTWFLHGRYDDGYDIYANYNLYGIEYYNLRDIQDLDLIREESEKSVVAIDEVDKAGFDSRQSSRNVEFTKYILQSRKFSKKSDVILDTQLWSTIDLRVKGVVHYVFEPQILLTEPETEKPLLLKVDYFDLNTRKYLNPWYVPLKFNFKHGYVDICESYDTSEFIDKITNNSGRANEELIRKYAGKNYTAADIMTMLMTVEQPEIPRSRADQLSKLIKLVDKGIIDIEVLTGHGKEKKEE